MERFNLSNFAAKAALVSALVLPLGFAAPALSQTSTGTGVPGTGTTTADAEYHQEGRNGYWGLLGLLGLFGLLGRRSSKNQDHDGTTAYRDPADVTSTRDRY